MSEYGFEENVDYSTVGQNCPIANGGFQFVTDHALTLDTAKEIAMIQRSEICIDLVKVTNDISK